jgi:hypothetical protein
MFQPPINTHCICKMVKQLHKVNLLKGAFLVGVPQ